VKRHWEPIEFEVKRRSHADLRKLQFLHGRQLDGRLSNRLRSLDRVADLIVLLNQAEQTPLLDVLCPVERREEFRDIVPVPLHLVHFHAINLFKDIVF